jgi:Gpi18-like mannosyltransferase
LESKRELPCIYFLAAMLLFALIVRLCAAVTFVNHLDTSLYISWAQGLQEGFFTVYDRIQVDYPPLYFFLLYFVGDYFSHVGDSAALAMYYIKIIPILFDLVLAAAAYCLFKKHIGKEAALLLSALVAFNPAVIFNSSYWGQTDSLLMLAVLFCFYCFEREKPVLGTVFFALGALCKNQMLLFAPLIVFELIATRRPALAAKSAGAGLLIGVAVFLPFMIGSGTGLRLPFDVYFGAFGEYPYINLNAFNVYGVVGHNWEPDAKQLFFTTYHGLSIFMMAVAVAAAGFIRFKARLRSPALTAFVFYQIIFLFTTRMHERYQIPVLILLLVCIALFKDIRLFILFCFLSVIVFANQAFVMLEQNSSALEGLSAALPKFQTAFSVVNLLVFAYSLYVVYDIAFLGKTQKAGPLRPQAPTEG